MQRLFPPVMQSPGLHPPERRSPQPVKYTGALFLRLRLPDKQNYSSFLLSPPPFAPSATVEPLFGRSAYDALDSFERVRRPLHHYPPPVLLVGG